MSVKTFAAIDVGSFELTMKIFDLSGKNTMREIDCIRQRMLTWARTPIPREG